MFRPDAKSRVCARSASRLIVGDLCAQLVPLNRYGLAGLGSAVVEGVLALASALRSALRAAAPHNESSDALA